MCDVIMVYNTIYHDDIFCHTFPIGAPGIYFRIETSRKVDIFIYTTCQQNGQKQAVSSFITA